MKILILDIETSPQVAYVWKFWKENITNKQVISNFHIMSFAAKWLDAEEIYYEDNRGNNDLKIVSSLCNLLDQADVVVAHNGSNFDIKKIKARALVHGIKPPSPFKVIDTYKIAKKEFGFVSNSLEALAEILDCKVKKGGHKKFPGFDLWKQCLKGNVEAWDEMKDYNIQDIIVLEEVYLKIRPWASSHPNLGMYIDQPDKPVCPKCGNNHMQYRGHALTATGKYHRLQCQICGGWSRSRYTLMEKNENVLVNQGN